MMLKVIEAGTLCRTLKEIFNYECSDFIQINPGTLLFVVGDIKETKSFYGDDALHSYFSGTILIEKRIVVATIKTRLSLERFFQLIEVENGCD